MGKLSTLVAAGSMATMMAGGGALAVQADTSATEHFGPFASDTVDGGSCGNTWAADHVNRWFSVTALGDGTFRLTEEFRDGTFTTIGGPSPGGCETAEHHGTVVAGGIVGSFRGSLNGKVSGGTFNAGGCTATPTSCATTHGFVTAVFGAGANFATTTFNFEYDSSDPALLYHHWQDRSTVQPIGEQFVGDIATA